MSWMLEQTSRICLVRILGKDHRRGVTNDQVIFVDANKGDILDCIELYVMIISHRSIKFCADNGLVLDSASEDHPIELRTTTPSTGETEIPTQMSASEKDDGQKGGDDDWLIVNEGKRVGVGS